MENLRQTFLKKYGIWEYILFALGLLILVKFGKWVWEGDFTIIGWAEIGIYVFLLSLGILLVAAPLSILEFARKKAGMQTRAQKLNE